MKRRKTDSDASFCISNGVSCYPIYQAVDVKDNRGKLIRKENHWYLEVEDNGRIITGKKAINKGKSCNKSTLRKMQDDTYAYYAKLIEKKNGQKDNS